MRDLSCPPVPQIIYTGSLSSLVYNHTVIIDTSLMWPILTDVSSGIEYLHFSTQAVVHGFVPSRVQRWSASRIICISTGVWRCCGASHSVPASQKPQAFQRDD